MAKKQEEIDEQEENIEDEKQHKKRGNVFGDPAFDVEF